ncbi:hypothetical protein [Mangrovihabitans endophyticus]|uniref:Lipoprotein n=1 Tax=Mangrovihabitans endophyticus TaxID=1751298 RepID=A0A8J3FNA6_9ACTN|nr:hypothetical protein [Mangrovihabitans endophyticus]GGK79923.1 hypothetical protein GCM10012284_12400 [Mangrovihabitans endophyticus]
MRRLLATVVAAAIALSGCSGEAAADLDARPQVSPSVASEVPEAECSAVTRAYESWRSRTVSRTGDSYAGIVRFHLDAVPDQSDAFADDVSGFPDQESRDLAAAVAQHNLALATIGVDLAVDGAPGDTSVADADAARGVHPVP